MRSSMVGLLGFMLTAPSVVLAQVQPSPPAATCVDDLVFGILVPGDRPAQAEWRLYVYRSSHRYIAVATARHDAFSKIQAEEYLTAWRSDPATQVGGTYHSLEQIQEAVREHCEKP